MNQVPAEPIAAIQRLGFLTLSIAVLIYAIFFLVMWFFQDLSIWIAAPIGALLLTWHGSLQHETIHGHPTSSRRFNALLASPPLALWIPYRIYRATHLQHHRHGGRYLTEIARDPESFFLEPGTQARSGRIRGDLYRANCTLAGRMILGPALSLSRFWTIEARKALSGDRRCRMLWTRHAVAVVLVLLWTAGVCHIPLTTYVMLLVYPSMSLTHLRSFAEHRAHADPAKRTMAVEAHALWALLFFNNNLHIAHHAHPRLPWHRLPRVWRAMRDTANQDQLVLEQGYRQVAGYFLFRPVMSVEHPDGLTTTRS
jgi:fatty acid desaturase